MPDLSQLLIGIVLLIASFGLMAFCAPRRGKSAWFVGVPFLEPGVSIVLVTGIVAGLLLIVAYFTALDEATLSGAAKHL